MKTVDYGPYGTIEYCVFDPTGNITALSVTEVEAEDRPSAAAVIMSAEPAVEQVGFVSFDKGAEVPARLDMAGGEFCGNAAMCAAALYLLTNEGADKAGSAAPADVACGAADGSAAGAKAADRTVKVKVSGAAAPVEVRLRRSDADASFEAAVLMPPALAIEELRLSDGMLPGSDVITLPVVKMEGISHVIIEPDSGFFGLKDDPVLAETLLRAWCGVLGAECLGMMFIDDHADAESADQEKKTVPDSLKITAGETITLTPLVYVPGADTMFWENSCASGSAAAGMYLAARAGSPADITFAEPAGRLRVESDPLAQTTVLHGSTHII